MSVFYCIPSARPASEANRVLELWKKMGYSVAIWRDTPNDPPICDLLLTGEYPGYAQAVNALAKEVLARDSECDWIVSGGDDIEPDPNHSPEEIAAECNKTFMVRGEVHIGRNALPDGLATFGVMQPTGDRFAGGQIDRIAGSPWMGREFCERMYGGKGPLYEGYVHCFEDEELQCVAQLLGVFWQRPDLIHKHMHFMRESEDINSNSVRRPIPPHLVEAFSREHWDKYSAIFRSRKAAGFPGHEPLPKYGADPRIVRNAKLDNGDPDLIEGGGIYGAGLRGGVCGK